MENSKKYDNKNKYWIEVNNLFWTILNFKLIVKKLFQQLMIKELFFEIGISA